MTQTKYGIWSTPTRTDVDRVPGWYYDNNGRHKTFNSYGEATNFMLTNGNIKYHTRQGRSIYEVREYHE